MGGGADGPAARAPSAAGRARARRGGEDGEGRGARHARGAERTIQPTPGAGCSIAKTAGSGASTLRPGSALRPPLGFSIPTAAAAALPSRTGRTACAAAPHDRPRPDRRVRTHPKNALKLAAPGRKCGRASGADARAAARAGAGAGAAAKGSAGAGIGGIRTPRPTRRCAGPCPGRPWKKARGRRLATQADAGIGCENRQDSPARPEHQGGARRQGVLRHAGNQRNKGGGRRAAPARTGRVQDSPRRRAPKAPGGAPSPARLTVRPAMRPESAAGAACPTRGAAGSGI